MSSFTDRLQHAWNAFLNRDPPYVYKDLGMSSSFRPDRPRLTKGNERSIINTIFNRISVDCAAIKIQHVKLDDKDRYKETINSNLNKCLTLEANLDQTGRAFIQDVVLSLLDEGCIAIIPTDTDIDIYKTASLDILSMRTGKILEWYPKDIKVRVYNEHTGQKEDVIIAKSKAAIIENPFYSVMNEQNSTLQRLIRKLNILDVIDEQSGSGKLDLIIQLPYVVKTETKQKQADERRKAIETQLNNSKYGIAYIDSTEHVTQLNRPADNNLMSQIEYLTSMLFSQLGITVEILNGTASEEAMINYNSRTIEPIISAIVDEMKRKFLTQTARTQKQTIMFFNEPFKLVPVSTIADIADKFTRNEIMSSNEIRQIVGMKPVESAQADELRNKNLNAGDGQKFATTKGTEETNIPVADQGEEKIQNGSKV